MALYYCNVFGVQCKVLDFSNIIDVVSGSTEAFLGYCSMTKVAQACTVCNCYLRIALTGFRFDDLPRNLCGVCGWVTGQPHNGFRCDLDGDTCVAWDQYFCHRCVYVQANACVCVHCLDWQVHIGISPKQRVIMQAWWYSHELADAINGTGLWERQMLGLLGDGVRLIYPSSVSQVLPYNANDGWY
jgi:hypothetical protein